VNAAPNETRIPASEELISCSPAAIRTNGAETCVRAIRKIQPDALPKPA